MNPRDKSEISDADPTDEQQTLDADLTRTDQINEKYTVSLDYTGEFATGAVDHDDRGQARWKWKTESTPTGETERTFDLLKALNNDALTIEGSAEQKPEHPPRQSGYDPYDVSGGSKSKPRKQ